jgi:hypothetical protein
LARQRQDLHERIAQLDRLSAASGAGGFGDAIRTALAERHHLVVARAAELAGERLLFGVAADLAALVTVELAVDRANSRLRATPRAALRQREDQALMSRFCQVWGADADHLGELGS